MVPVTTKRIIHSNGCLNLRTGQRICTHSYVTNMVRKTSLDSMLIWTKLHRISIAQSCPSKMVSLRSKRCLQVRTNSSSQLAPKRSMMNWQKSIVIGTWFVAQACLERLNADAHPKSISVTQMPGAFLLRKKLSNIRRFSVTCKRNKQWQNDV